MVKLLKKIKNKKNIKWEHGTKQSVEGIFFKAWELKQEGRKWPCWTSGRGGAFPLRVSANECKGAGIINVGATDKFQQAGKFANTESVNNEDWLYNNNIVVSSSFPSH